MNFTMNNKFISGIILAGGKSSRLGRNKALEKLGGATLISRVINNISKIANEIVIVINHEDVKQQLPIPKNAKIAVDLYSNKGSLSGIHSGLNSMSGKYGIVVARDMPYINYKIFEYLITKTNGHDIVIPNINDRLQPTHAIYSKSCVKEIEKQLINNDLKITNFFSNMKVKEIFEKDLISFKDYDLSFFNINTEEDLNIAKSTIGRYNDPR